tara:strand:- start:5527 stop:6588 length:1062 start_codon:yes stop_codon:yes gene_type:complete
MAGTSRDAGIPVIRSRIDATEEAKEWNKMREAVTSIYESGTVVSDSRVAIPLVGFRPIARVDVDAGASVAAGVGVTAGTLRFLESSAITEASGDRNEAVEVMPTLDGTALDADPTPREYLAAGDREAWVVFKELGSTHEARIVFAAEDAGPGTLDRDEKAERLATFEVTYPGGTDASGQVPGITIKEQFIRDELAIWTERHQFKARKTADNKIKIDSGWVLFPEGTWGPLVAGSGRSCTHEVAESAEFTIAEAGSIWLKGTWTVGQLSTSDADDHTLTMYRLYDVSSLSFEFRAVTNPPSPGDNDSDVWTTGDIYWEVCKLSFAAGETFITDQIISGPIYLTEFTDGKLSNGS